jgi:uncharacterized membrane protein YedE/YeeE
MYWSWMRSGFALGLCFLITVVLVKPIGVSTQFVILDGMIGSAFSDNLVVADDTAKSGYKSSNPYLNKSGGKYAKAVANPLNYSFIFVLAMAVGGLLGRLLHKRSGGEIRQVPECHQQRFGENATRRHMLAFIGGIIVLWGARLAGGCTSGHMMSGMMQTSVSGYFFALTAFVIGIPTAIMIYRK